MILLRATAVDDQLSAFGDQLAAASGLPLVYLLDERRGPVRADGPKIGLTREACEKLGLFCPTDFAWRCGDYGFYLARQCYPEASCYWQIEYDVRFLGPCLDKFFAAAARDPADLLAVGFGPARDWWWGMFAQARNVVPHRAFFPVTRLLPDAVDVLLAKRVEQAQQWLRRAQWPNDEAFVATTAAANGFRVRDLNTVWPELYDNRSFTFDAPLNGEALTSAPAPLRLHLYHPVLFGKAYTDKLARLEVQAAREPVSARTRRKLLAKAGRLRAW